MSIGVVADMVDCMAGGTQGFKSDGVLIKREASGLITFRVAKRIIARLGGKNRGAGFVYYLLYTAYVIGVVMRD